MSFRISFETDACFLFRLLKSLVSLNCYFTILSGGYLRIDNVFSSRAINGNKLIELKCQDKVSHTGIGVRVVAPYIKNGGPAGEGAWLSQWSFYKIGSKQAAGAKGSSRSWLKHFHGT
ncbi:unnamed protein product [Leptosia nina]|uniref:Uncharacterized protein n=1 Tax=Leptosia nina TaxID=320188 RepID=A0AAV1K0X7_9NEOP